MSWVRIINLSFQLWGSAMSLIIIACLVLSGRTKLKSDRRFLYIVGFNLFAMLMDALALYFRGGERMVDWYGTRISNYLQFTSANMMAMTFILYQRAYLEERIKKTISHIYSKIAVAATIISQILLTINLVYPFLYIIDENNIYNRLSLYPLVFMSSLMVLVLSVSIVWVMRKKLERKEKITFLVYTLVPFVCLILSILIYGIVFGYFGITASIVMVFILLQSEQGKRVVEQEKEIVQSKIDTMLSQIQPHFLYNVLSSISVLCEKDPKLASMAADNFGVYMRTNLNNLKRNGLITLEEEMKHVKNYVWLEKLRFEEGLEVSYELEDVNIHLPAMSVQPLVENAILHGMMGREGVCHIRISAVDKGEYVEICVEDDGVGFDINEKKDDGRSHIGLENVQKSLEYLVGGYMLIESELGKGTKITLRIPEEE